MRYRFFRAGFSGDSNARQWPGDLKLALAAILAALIFCWHYPAGIGGVDAILYALVIILVVDAGYRRLTEVAEQKKSQAALKASEIRFRTIFETLPVAIWEHDFTEVKRELDRLKAGGVHDLRKYIFCNPGFAARMRDLVRITDANRTALQLMEIPAKEHFFKSLAQLLPEADKNFADCLIAIDEGHSRFETEATIRSRTGRMINVLVGLNFPPRGEGLDRIQGCIVDITKRINIQGALDEAQAELERKSRAALLGEISGSIAHEVNQPLAAVKTSAQAAMRWLSLSPPNLNEVDAALKDVVAASDLAEQVVKRVRMLLSTARTELAPVRIESVIREVVRLKRRELVYHGVQTTLDFNKESPIILADRVLLQQVLLNLIANAVQALQEMPIESRALSITSEAAEGRLLMRLTDTGPGIAAGIEHNLFKAFVTTKADGMGLGLATCRSIVTAHGGTISMENNFRGSGATVTISLPIHMDEPIRDEPAGFAGNSAVVAWLEGCHSM